MVWIKERVNIKTDSSCKIDRNTPRIAQDKRFLEFKDKHIQSVERSGFGYLPVDYGLEEDLIEDFDENHAKKKLLVAEILRTWEPARNSYRLLDFEALRLEFPEIQVTSSQENVIFKIPKKIIRFLPSPETYSRALRSLINEAKKKGKIEDLKDFLPTDPQVIARRIKREKIIKLFFSNSMN